MANHDAGAIDGRDEMLIDAEPDLVWQFLSDAGGWPDWRTGVTAVSIEGTLTTGTEFSWTVDGQETTAVVLEVGRGSSVGWEARTGEVVERQHWTLEPYEHSTMVQVAASWSPGPDGHPRSEAQAALDRTLQAWLRDLKAIAEAPALEGHA